MLIRNNKVELCARIENLATKFRVQTMVIHIEGCNMDEVYPISLTRVIHLVCVICVLVLAEMVGRES